MVRLNGLKWAEGGVQGWVVCTHDWSVLWAIKWYAGVTVYIITIIGVSGLHNSYLDSTTKPTDNGGDCESHLTREDVS